MQTSKVFFSIAIVVFLLDQLTKALALYFLLPGKGDLLSFMAGYFANLGKFPYELSHVSDGPKIFGEYLKLTLTTNDGIAWGLFKGYPIQLGILSIVLSIIILLLFYKFGRRSFYIAVSFGLIFGGAVGNLFDRLRLLKVVDFIDVLIPILNYDFPIFNTADASASIGTFLIAIYLVRLDILSFKRKRILEKYDLTMYS